MGSNIRAMIADVEVEDLEAAIPLYRERHPGDRLDFQDRFAFIRGTRP